MSSLTTQWTQLSNNPRNGRECRNVIMLGAALAGNPHLMYGDKPQVRTSQYSANVLSLDPRPGLSVHDSTQFK